MRQLLSVVLDQFVFMCASVLHRQCGDDEVTDVVHAESARAELPIQQTSTAVGKHVGVPDVAIAMQQRRRQRCLVQLSRVHLLQQGARSLAYRFDQLAFELLSLHLPVHQHRHAAFMGEEVVNGSARMRLHPGQIAVEARRLPVAGVQNRQLAHDVLDATGVDGCEHVGKFGVANAEILQRKPNELVDLWRTAPTHRGTITGSSSARCS